MHWTATSDPTTHEVVGLSVFAEHQTPARLVLQYGGGRRLRIVRADAPLLWARVAPRYEGVWTVRTRGQQVLGILPPIRADEARAMRTSLDAMKWVAGVLTGSAPPLRSGVWQLSEMLPVSASLHDRALGRAPDVLRSRDPDGLPGPAHGLGAALSVPRVHMEQWGISGSAGVLPLREPSDADAARVKSWRKHARDGTLPPVVLWWVSAFDMYVLVDGHDRLLAATLEGLQPRAIALWQARHYDVGDPDTWRPELVRSYERAFAAGDKLSMRTRLQMNRSLVEAFRGHRASRTRALAHYQLNAEWTAEVQAELADDSALAQRICG